MIDRVILLIPIFGELMRKIAVARFCRTLATLTSSGVPILDGLEITAKTAGNSIIEDAVMEVRKSVEEGNKDSTAQLMIKTSVGFFERHLMKRKAPILKRKLIIDCYGCL